MYFIELLVNIFNKRHKPKNIENFNPLNDKLYDEDYETCEHVFMPIDSTGEILACRNCGMVVKRKDLKNKNFFMK